MRRLVLCLALFAPCAFAQDSQPVHKPAKKVVALKKRLQEQQLDLNLEDNSLSDALGMLQAVTNINLAVAPGVDLSSKLSLDTKGTSVAKLLDAIGSAVEPKLSWSIVDGVAVHLHKADAKAPVTPKVDDAWLAQNGRQRLSLKFPGGTSLAEATEFLNAMHGLAFEVGELGDAEVSLSLDDCPLPTTLTLLADNVGATWTVKDDAVHFTPVKKKAK